MRNITIDWLYKASQLTVGEELYFPAESKQVQKDLYKLFLRELKVMSEIDAVMASTIAVAPTFKDKRHWVLLRKTAGTPTTAFKKNTVTGEVERVLLHDDTDRQRRIRLMIEDGLSIDQITELEGELTEGEKRRYIV
jgi:hypothetical protein